MNDRRRILALTIWWCEGTKPRKDKRWKNSYLYPIEVTNCDPKIIKIFADFLRDEIGVPNERIKGQLQIHENDNKEKIESFWSKKIGLPLSQFNKTIIRKIGHKPGKNTGTFKLRTYNKNVYLKLQSLLEKELEKADFGEWRSW
ncbi:hypothetical protein COT64_02250 [Candidatus Shapirobacteria bacterium CG09_land_8_20_14_0_10_39_12]|uniref:Homing endonuclease LAGLIDADG domain-containing protein n=1 Tax=Candidatus Shapirobacteria bacterium CG09_land_8_20_14_0_10_39_12 TaxID=1974885 RepID=A0A2H0WRG0_9BACT|nr:MAG: hypothetical protein COT64_02250 [Candidatus Shapirobacteria bacterium CG09_land_8_20_14_0_10_39_12]